MNTTNKKMKQVGKKFDIGKDRFDLIPPTALIALAKLYSTGAYKYGDRNWELGMAYGRVFAAMMRHSWKWWGGEKYDKEDGQPHLISVAWCAFTLFTFEDAKVGEDDRSTVTRRT